jgi:NADH:ubiquinone oxidoreductase subunit 2 (subunit N)
MICFIGWIRGHRGGGMEVGSWGRVAEVEMWAPNAEPFLKYFLSQSVGTSMFLFTPILWRFFNLFEYGGLIFLFGLIIKGGVAPFHQWFPSVCANVSWGVNSVLLIWQKIGPLFIILGILNVRMLFLILVSLINLIFGVWGAIGQRQFRSFMAYSSITHMGWMCMMGGFSKFGFFFYFVFYVIVLMFLIKLLAWGGVYNFGGVKSVGVWGVDGVGVIRILLLNLAGFPPTLGFFLKVYVLSFLLGEGFFVISLVMSLFALAALFYYINISFLRVLLFIVENKGVWGEEMVMGGGIKRLLWGVIFVLLFFFRLPFLGIIVG